MDRTPGVILPSSYPSQKDLENDLHRRDREAGFKLFDPNEFAHSSDNVETFLEHHGVKGMRWGVRRAAKKVKYGLDIGGARTKDVGAGQLSKKEQTAHILGVAAVTTGLVATGIILRRNKNLKFSNMLKNDQAFHNARMFLMNRNDIKISQIRSASKAGSLTPDQTQRLISLTTKQTLSGLKRAHEAFKAAGGV